MGSMRCLVVDDDWFTRQGLTQCLRSVGGVDVAGEAASLAEALEHDGPLDVVLLDLGLPGTCRRTATATLLHEWPNVRVLVITAHATGPDVVQAFAEGASGYVTKNASPDELVRALQAVAAGGTYVTPDLAGHLLNGTFRLTERQRAVLRLVGMGLTNADVARELCLTEKTVENYLAAIRGACGLLNRPRSELTRFAIESDPGCLLEPQQHGEGPDGCGVRRGRRRGGKERPSKRSS